MQEGPHHQKLRVTGHIAHHHKWLATFLLYQNPKEKKKKTEEEENSFGRGEKQKSKYLGQVKQCACVHFNKSMHIHQREAGVKS